MLNNQMVKVTTDLDPQFFGVEHGPSWTQGRLACFGHHSWVLKHVETMKSM
jgi:hypothetical protein